MHILEAQELYRFFHTRDEEIKALRGVDFSLNRGELVALMGPSGSANPLCWPVWQGSMSRMAGWFTP